MDSARDKWYLGDSELINEDTCNYFNTKQEFKVSGIGEQRSGYGKNG